MQHLPLQVGQVDPIAVDQCQGADAGGRQVQRGRRAKPSGTDDQHVRAAQPLLALDAEFVQQDMPRVAQQLFVVQRRAQKKTGRSAARLSRWCVYRAGALATFSPLGFATSTGLPLR